MTACSTDSHSHSQKKALSLFLVYYDYIPSSSFRSWVPDLNLNKSLEPMSETTCISTSCTQNILSTLYITSSQFTLPACIEILYR